MESKTVLVMVPMRDDDKKKFEAAAPGFYFIYNEAPTDDELGRAHIIIGEPSQEMMNTAGRLEWLQISWAGVDDYTKGFDFPKNVFFTNMSGAFGQSISEYVLAMILSLYKKMHLYRDQQNREVWEDCGREVSPVGKTVLITGVGNVGGAVAALMKKFDCTTLGITMFVGKIPEYMDEMYTLDALDDLLPRADIIVNCLPSTDKTKGLFDAKRIGLMKTGALFVNVARGDVADTMALVDALHSGKLFGAAVDVTDPEPLPKGHPLWKCKNAVITPHISGGCFGHLVETENKIIELCAENLSRYAGGKELLNEVDIIAGYKKEEPQ
jgi:phosphoglycerate dehydrogenase-like enzyme